MTPEKASFAAFVFFASGALTQWACLGETTAFKLFKRPTVSLALKVIVGAWYAMGIATIAISARTTAVGYTDDVPVRILVACVLPMVGSVILGFTLGFLVNHKNSNSR